MRKKRIFVAFLFIVSLFHFFIVSASQASAQGFLPDETSNKIIVRFKEPQAMGHKISKMLNQGVELEEKLLLENTFTFETTPGQAEETASDLEKDPEVLYAEPDYILYAFETPNDPDFGKQWGMTKIEAPKAWDLTHGSPQVKVAILDTGIDKDHPDLSSKVERWVNFSGSSTEDDRAGHGTHTGGIVGAVTNNGVGVAGTSYDTHLLSVKVLYDDGSGSTSSVANGIKWAADNGAKVINMSLGFYGNSSTLETAVNEAWSKGVVIVASAGNCGEGGPRCPPGVNPIAYPARYENVIAVASTTSNDGKSSFSNYGSWVDVAAPGSSIYSTLPNHDHGLDSRGLNYGYLDGTSMSAPHVAGLAGLLFGANPSLTAAQVRNLIEQKADKISGTGTYWTHGRINAYQSVLGATSGVTITPTPTGGVTPTPTGGLTPTPTGGVTPTPTPTGGLTPTPTKAPFNCAINGDFDGSGAVNEADFNLWKTAFLEGRAALSCFEYWRRNARFGATPTPGEGLTPTPTGALTPSLSPTPIQSVTPTPTSNLTPTPTPVAECKKEGQPCQRTEECCQGLFCCPRCGACLPSATHFH